MDQIDSSSKPEPQLKNEATQNQQAQTGVWSSMKLLSVNLSELMREIIASGSVDAALQAEDLAHISNALEHSKFAKQFDMVCQLEMAIFHRRKAAKIVDQLYLLRKEKYPVYQVLLAPFYFKVGDALCSYIEINTNEMNQLKPLMMPEDPDDLQQMQQEQQEEQAASQASKEENKNGDAGKKDEDEPQIEDVIDSSAKPAAEAAATSDSVQQLGVANEEFEQLTEDVFENFSLAIQIIDDFRSEAGLEKQQVVARNKLLSSLRIDCIQRRADYAKFYNDVDTAKADYIDVIKICQEYPDGNEGIIGSVYFSLGKLYLDIGQRVDALDNFKKVQEIQKQSLLRQLKDLGQSIEDQDVPIAKLTEPSIFDNDSIKDIKATLLDIQEFIKECADMEQIQPKLDQMKAEAKEQEGVDTSVPEGFGQPQADAETFKPIAIKSRKRNFQQATATDVVKNAPVENTEELKKRKIDEIQQ